MDLASQLLGMETLMLELATGDKAELVHRLLDYARQVATRYAFALIESGAHSTSIGEPVAGPDVISPRAYRKYAQPQEKRMVDDLKARGIILHNHICGNTIPIIHDFVGTGAQVLEIDHKTDAEGKGRARGKTCLLGPINTGTITSGTRRRWRTPAARRSPSWLPIAVSSWAPVALWVRRLLPTTSTRLWSRQRSTACTAEAPA
jgi:uroporphyrinogen-III decarboxylase